MTGAGLERLGGTVAAAVTPLRADGDALDVEAIGPLVDHYARAEVDGVLAMGTTGEGILLSPSERRRAADAFVQAARGRLLVMVHCGAQTTADTVALAAYCAENGADAVAVIGPPYFAYDDRALLEHFAAAAAACAPLPFFVYEFAARSGYAVPLAVLAQLRERQPNFVGLKVSDSPWERIEPYLLEGMRVFIGPEGLMHRGFQAGAVGVVSGLAGGLPAVVVRSVRERTEASAARAGEIRAAVDRFPFQAALKHLLLRQGLPIREDVRRPLRGLTPEETVELDRLVPALAAASGRA